MSGQPRVLAVHLPDLPVQRFRRAREPAAEGGRPIAVMEEGCVVCCDGAARVAGVRPGMTAAEAHAACGRLATVPHDPAADRAALRALAEVLLGLAPAIEVSPPDALLVDASAAHLVAGHASGRGPEEEERALAEQVLGVVAEMGYAGRATVATGRGPARALAHHVWRVGEDDRIRSVPPGDTALALSPLPIAALGLASGVVARLAALGLDTAGSLARLPEGTLAHRFGPDGVAAARLARGDDPSPLVPYVPETFPEEAIELEAPAESAEPLRPLVAEHRQVAPAHPQRGEPPPLPFRHHLFGRGEEPGRPVRRLRRRRGRGPGAARWMKRHRAVCALGPVPFHRLRREQGAFPEPHREPRQDPLQRGDRLRPIPERELLGGGRRDLHRNEPEAGHGTW